MWDHTTNFIARNLIVSPLEQLATSPSLHWELDPSANLHFNALSPLPLLIVRTVLVVLVKGLLQNVA
jgi:hypothetical protein